MIIYINVVVLAQDAIKAALNDYQTKNQRQTEESVKAAVNWSRQLEHKDLNDKDAITDVLCGNRLSVTETVDTRVDLYSVNSVLLLHCCQGAFRVALFSSKNIFMTTLSSSNCHEFGDRWKYHSLLNVCVCVCIYTCDDAIEDNLHCYNIYLVI